MPLTDAQLREAAQGCARHLSGTLAARTPVQDLEDLLAEARRGGDRDLYGAGGVVAEVEEQVRALLDAPAAVLLPTGTMASQVALRHWCRASARVGLHRTAHALLHEDDALPVVQGLVTVVYGEHPTVEALDAEHARSPLGAVLVELPQRETGGQLLPFDDLAAIAAWCDAHGVGLHLDGARLWECGPAYAPRPLSDVVALAGSTYVSLYKGLGALAGAVLLGPEDFVAAARLARHRLGGAMPALWPIALGARRGLRDLLPAMPAAVAHAQELARALDAAGVEVVVPPVTPLLHVVLPGAVDEVQDALVAVSRESGTWLGRAQPGPREGTSRVELYVGPGRPAVPPGEGAALLAQAQERVRAAS